MDNRKCVLLFPPNWSACVSAPHLAMPLLAGATRDADWDVETWDLSTEYYYGSSHPPSLALLDNFCKSGNFEALDKLYFDWEDQFSSSYANMFGASRFGLLSGYHFPHLEEFSLAEVAEQVRNGTVYSNFYNDRVIPHLIEANPTVVGVTIASENQIIPALELLYWLRSDLPETFIVLGGNVVTRLRKSKAFGTLTSLADQVVLFQGESCFSETLHIICELGVRKAREFTASPVSVEQINYDSWPTPYFNGIDFEHIVGTPVIPYVSTRGCYWGKCKFCAIPAGWSSTGYAGSAPADFVAGQLQDVLSETGIPRIKFVDESFPPAKARDLAHLLIQRKLHLEWEIYARLDPIWENPAFVEQLSTGGLRKVYFGLELAPGMKRFLLNKKDGGNPTIILETCKKAGVKVHLFTMVGYPGTTEKDAHALIRFLLDHETLIDTADLASFHLERETEIPGIKPTKNKICDWRISVSYEPTAQHVLSMVDVKELEKECQELIWEKVPRFLHPLYRVVGSWSSNSLRRRNVDHLCEGSLCSNSLFSTV